MIFKSIYFLLATVLLLSEVFIALSVRDAFIRPYFGDFLATVLVYTSIRAISRYSVRKSLLISLLFSYAVEFLQAIDFLSIAGLYSSEAISVIMGSSFDWADIIAYTLAAIVVIIIEEKINKHSRYNYENRKI